MSPQLAERELIRFAQKLIKTPSPSGQEKLISKVLSAEMERVGFDYVKVDKMWNVIGKVNGKSPHLRLMFNGHIDHAAVGTMKNAFSGEIVNHKGRRVIWGRGACDMKGAVAAMIYACKAVKESGIALETSVAVTAVALEEIALGEGIKYLLEKKKMRADMAVSGEATDLQIHLGHRGELEFDVMVKGRTTHASTPSLGLNAIFQMKKFLAKLERYKLPVDSFLGPCTATVIDISASPGRPTPIIPDRCNLVVDRRYIPSESPESVKRELKKLVAQIKKQDPRFQAEVCLAKDFPPYFCPPREEIVKLLQGARKKVLGEEGKLKAWRFGVEGTFIHRAGIPCAGFGPGNEDFAHTPEDHVAVEDVVKAARVYIQIILDACR